MILVMNLTPLAGGILYFFSWHYPVDFHASWPVSLSSQSRLSGKLGMTQGKIIVASGRKSLRRVIDQKHDVLSEWQNFIQILLNKHVASLVNGLGSGWSWEMESRNSYFCLIFTLCLWALLLSHPYKLSYPIVRSFPGQFQLLNELIFSYKTSRYCKLTFWVFI